MFISTAHAAAGSAPPGGDIVATLLASPIPALVIITAVFWLLLIRPQQARLKAHRAQIAAVKRGDQVVTGGGLLGKITKVTDDEVEVELAPNLRVRALKATLTDIRQPGVPVPANDAKG